MWIPSQVVDWFHISREHVTTMREELAAAKAELATLKVQAAVDKTHMDWLITKVNALEQERVALIQKAYDIRLPTVPEILRTPRHEPDPNAFSFEDIGEELAKRFNMPIYDPVQTS